MFKRGAPINRFFDLHRDPQANIFYDYATNTSLEAKDNFVPDLPVPMSSDVVPRNCDSNAGLNMTFNPNKHKIANNRCGFKCSGNNNQNLNRTHQQNRDSFYR
jgi:hypothetical protein